MKGYLETGHDIVHQPLVEPHGGQNLNGVPEMHKLSQNNNIVQYDAKNTLLGEKSFAFTSVLGALAELRKLTDRQTQACLSLRPSIRQSAVGSQWTDFHQI
jgi:hypothetical protein